MLSNNNFISLGILGQMESEALGSPNTENQGKWLKSKDTKCYTRNNYILDCQLYYYIISAHDFNGSLRYYVLQAWIPRVRIL